MSRSATPVPLLARLADAALCHYARWTPSGRGGLRLVRAARKIYPAGSMARDFELPDSTLMRLDLAQYPDCTMAFGLYELETVRAVRRTLRPGDVFVDVGANIGYFTLLAARRVGPAGRVHAFEPWPDNHSRLMHHARLNNVESSVSIHASAVSNFSGELRLHRYSERAANHGQVTAFPREGASTQTATVPVTTLDDVMPGVAPRLIKLDVEGSEFAALEGMRGMLRRARPALIMEVNPVTFDSAGVGLREMVALLREAVPDYRCWALRWPVRQIDPLGAALREMGEVNILFELPERFSA